MCKVRSCLHEVDEVIEVLCADTRDVVLYAKYIERFQREICIILVSFLNCLEINTV